MSGLIDGIPGFSKAWKTLVATPTKYFNNKSNGTIDKVGNGIIQFVGNISPTAANELARQWDSDLGNDRKQAVLNAMQIIKDNNAKIVENQKLLTQAQNAMDGVSLVSSRATNKYQTRKALYDKVQKLNKQSVNLNAIANAAANQLGDINEYSNMTAGEMQRRTNTVQDIINKYERGNN